MLAIPDEVRQHLQRHHQEHVLGWWEQISAGEREQLLAQLRALDLNELRQLYQQRDTVYRLPRPETIQPVPVIAAGAQNNPEARRRGEEALRLGEVAVLVVAGGQG